MTETIDAAIDRLTREIAERRAILESLRAFRRLPTPVVMPTPPVQMPPEPSWQKHWLTPLTVPPFTYTDGVSTGCTCPPSYHDCAITGCPRATRVTMDGHG